MNASPHAFADATPVARPSPASPPASPGERPAPLIPLRLQGGVWEGLLARPRPLAATHRGRALDLTQTPVADGILVRVPVPPEAIADGVETVVIACAATGEVLHAVHLACGRAVADDLVADVSRLRAELDLLGAAVRRMGRGG